MKRYKALMIDLDGTTVPNHRDGKPSKQVIEAIGKAQKVMHVSVVTSRLIYQATPIIDLLELTSPCVVDGGSQILDPQSKKILWEQPLEKDDAKMLWQFAEKNNLSFKYSDGSVNTNPPNPKLPKKMLDILFRELTNETADILITKLSHTPTLSFHKIVSWNLGTIDLKISHATATKQHGIVKISEYLGIKPHEIIGVGDGYNDFPLLMASGLKVAMGNAVDDLKAIADYVAPPVEQDGLVDVIEKFVLQ